MSNFTEGWTFKYQQKLQISWFSIKYQVQVSNLCQLLNNSIIQVQQVDVCGDKSLIIFAYLMLSMQYVMKSNGVYTYTKETMLVLLVNL